MTDLNNTPADAEPQRLPAAHLKALAYQVANREIDFREMIRAMEPIISDQQRLSPESALELSIALHDIEQQAASEDQLYQLVEQSSTPSLVLSEHGSLLNANSAGLELLQVQMGCSLQQLGISPKDFDQFKARLMQQADTTLIKLARPGQTQELIMLGRYQHHLRAFVLSALQHSWPQAIDTALGELFGLTSSERCVLACLAQGLTSEQIAQQRHRSLGTVRQQVKAVLQKLGAQNQLQAATMAAAAASAVHQKQMPPSGDLLPQSGMAPLRQYEIMHAGRRLGFRLFGCLEKYQATALYLHGPFFGAGDFDQERTQAALHGIRVLAVERPGYGRTQPPQRGQSAIDCMLSDIEAVVSHLKAEPNLCISHEIGCILGLALAQRQPAWVGQLFAISAAPPYQEAKQIHSMPAQQSVFIWAAKHTPWLVRLLIRLGMVRLRKLGPKAWYQAVFGEVEQDIQALEQDHLASAAVAVYGFNIQQLGAGFEQDLALYISDWSAWVKTFNAPLHLLHGSNNQTTRLDHLLLFTQLQPRSHIIEFAGQGQTLAVTQPEAIWAYIGKALAQPC